MTNLQSAINVLKTARNVYHWNDIRENLKKDLTMKEIQHIDCSGLIVEVLGQDNRRVTYYEPDLD